MGAQRKRQLEDGGGKTSEVEHEEGEEEEEGFPRKEEEEEEVPRKKRRLLVITQSLLVVGVAPQRPVVVGAPSRYRTVGRDDVNGRGRHSTTETAGGPPRSDDRLKEMLFEKRLVLVLDLDHTLLHSTKELSSHETYLLHGSNQRPLLFDRRDTIGLLTKLRPFTYPFLREVSTMYHLCICTMGNSVYSQEMSKILDPEGVYFFSDNVLSRSDFTVSGKKGLDVVCGGDERVTIILDDTIGVWEERYQSNIIPMPPYLYFSSCRRKLGPTWVSPSELKVDELTGVLLRVLGILRMIHRRFFTGGSWSYLLVRDVRQIWKQIMRELREKPESFSQDKY